MRRQSSADTKGSRDSLKQRHRGAETEKSRAGQSRHREMQRWQAANQLEIEAKDDI